MAKNQRYKCLVGINYPPDNRRADAGSVVDDLSPASVKALLEMGAIEATDEPANRIDADGEMIYQALTAPAIAAAAEPPVDPAPDAPAPPDAAEPTAKEG